MNVGVPPKHESLAGDFLAANRRSALQASRRTFRVGLILLEQRPGRHRDRGLGGCCPILSAGWLHGHEHRSHDDVRRPRSCSRFVGDR
jgi:hypothetical protein